VKLPGVIATPVAPVVDQLSELLEPDEMLLGFAVNELIVGLLAALTVTVTVKLTDPAEFFAVKV
jgi:flagellar biosynthesis protein FliR